MNPLVNICEGDKYEIILTDVTQDSDEYISESGTSVYKENKFKYSDTNTINIITKVTIDKTQVLSTIITDHSSHLDEAHYKMESDGYYVIHHLILPTLEWLQEELNRSHGVLGNDVAVYVCDCDNIYYYYKGELKQKTPEDIIQINTTDTTISKVLIERFSIAYLYDCFISLCKQIFKIANLRCLNKSDFGDLQFKRDFIWMSLNVIKYYTEMGQLLESQRILEEINYCGGLCNEEQLATQSSSGCGCNK